MKLLATLGAALLTLAACTHGPQNAQYSLPADYQEKLYQKIGAEMMAEAQARRVPAEENKQLKTLKAQLGDLNRLKPGKFEIYVFPKMSTQTHKMSHLEKAVILGKPQVAEVSVVTVASCEFLIKKAGFAKYNPAQYFDSELARNKNNSCAIIEVSSRDMKNLNKALLREGDVMAKRLYLDSSYNVYGVETDLYSRSAKQKEMRMKTVGMKLEPGSASTAGLDFLPVDLPSVARIEDLETVDAKSLFTGSGKASDFTFKSDGSLVDRVAFRQITRLNKSFQVPSCAMRKMSYKDHFRKSVEMYWCEGLPWPQVVDSSQFVAVTQNISVR